MTMWKNTQENTWNKVWHRVHPQKQHTSLQYRKITLFHTDIYRAPDSSLCDKAYQKHNQANLYVKLGPHKHHYNKQATYHTVWLSRICSYPSLWARLNMQNMNILCGTVQRTSSARIQNYADSDGETGIGGNFRLSHATPHSYPQLIKQQKLHDSCNVLSDQFNMRFRLRNGSPTYRHKPAGDAYHFIVFHMRPTNQQPTRTGVDLCHKNFECPWFTETRVIRYQPFVLVHNAWFHSECHTNDKGSNQTCENNFIPPTNIQYLKIHVRN